jgi:glycosyltransferase involved in cell wall biosynthesis
VRSIHVVVPDGIDDPARPSGGNTYDRRLCGALAEVGWDVAVHPVEGAWPFPDASVEAALSAVLDGIPDGASVLLDGLVVSTAPAAAVPEARRLRLIPLVHMQVGGAGEGAVLTAASDVVVTSEHARELLLQTYAMPRERVHVAEPGVDPADLAPGTPTGGALLCVAAVIPGKGHDVLIDALNRIGGGGWRCTCVGSLDRNPAFADEVRRSAGEHVTFTGPLARDALDRSYAAADLLVLTSRAESYGLVVTEALARGLPVVASDVGGVPQALGRAPGGVRPGLLVPPDDPAALATALEAWLGDADLRERLRRAAAERRAALPDWAATASVIAGVVG